jgi:hypothetical protein
MYVGLKKTIFDSNDFGVGIFVVLRGKVMLTRKHGAGTKRLCCDATLY